MTYVRDFTGAAPHRGRRLRVEMEDGGDHRRCRRKSQPQGGPHIVISPNSQMFATAERDSPTIWLVTFGCVADKVSIDDLWSMKTRDVGQATTQ